MNDASSLVEAWVHLSSSELRCRLNTADARVVARARGLYLKLSYEMLYGGWGVDLLS